MGESGTRTAVRVGVTWLDVYGLRVSFTSPSPEHHAALDADYAPFRVASAAGPAALAVTVGEPPDPASRRLTGALGDEIGLADGSIAVNGPQACSAYSYLREIRPYLTAHIVGMLRRTGAVNLHAGCVRDGRGAVVVAGEKKSGKTSMVLTMVTGGWDYIGNEMVLLLPGPGGAEAAGLPQPMGIGVGTQQWFAEHAPQLGLAPSAVLPDAAGADALYVFEPAEKLQLSRELLVGLGNSAGGTGPDRFRAPLRGLLFPEPGLTLHEPRSLRLDPDEAAARLLQNVDFFLKWGLPPEEPFAVLVDSTRRAVEAAVATGPAFHVQWCADHSRNLAHLEHILGAPS